MTFIYLIFAAIVVYGGVHFTSMLSEGDKTFPQAIALGMITIIFTLYFVGCAINNANKNGNGPSSPATSTPVATKTCTCTK